MIEACFRELEPRKPRMSDCPEHVPYVRCFARSRAPDWDTSSDALHAFARVPRRASLRGGKLGVGNDIVSNLGDPLSAIAMHED